MQKEDWDDFRIALAVARGGSFAEAARLLGVNESTVVRRLAQAEQRLSARLFDRSPGIVVPTDAGLELIRRAERVEKEVHAATHVIGGSDTQIAGTVRLTSVPLLINRVLVPALSSLVHEHPNLQIELIAEPRVLSLTKREADIALRLARPQEELRSIARKLGDLRYAVYCPEGADFDSLPWLTYEDRMSDLPQAGWIAQQVASEPRSQARIRVNDAEGLLACLSAGLGKTLLPIMIGDRTAGLVRSEKQKFNLSRELWLVVHPDLRKLDRVRAVVDWVIATCVARDI
jgi:DNA-binding transcriptional LysR family regulator